MSRRRQSVGMLFAAAMFFVLPLTLARSQSTPAGSSPSADAKIELSPGLDKQLIDTKADPCVNFAAYACGNFSRLHPIPSDKPGFDMMTIVSDYTQQVLHKMLEAEAAGGAHRTDNEQKVGDFYATCMDEDAINRQGLKPLQAQLDKVAALKDKSQLTDLLAEYQMLNINAFFGLGEQQDFLDATKQIAAVDQGGLGLPERDYYFRTGDAAETTRKQYVAHIAKMFQLMGEPADQAAADAQKVMALETELAKASMDVTARRDPKHVYHPMSVTQLQGLNSEIKWPELFAGTTSARIADLNVANPEFFKALQKLLDSTDLETIKTYLRWQVVNSTASYVLPKALDDEAFDFYGHKLSGRLTHEARWKRCAEATDGALGEALGQVYVASQFSAAEKASTVQMVRDIEGAMDSEIDALAWMSPETKVQAKAKLHKVANKIGYPDHWRDYSALKVVRGDAMGNQGRAVEFENRRLMAKIGKPVDRGEFGMSPPTINAYYNPSMNDINFPAGILQSPFYDSKGTDAENYGHMGAVVGHELTHGFDDQGRQFDQNGNMKDWWTPTDATKFNAMTDCEVNEYSGFTAVDDVKLNGKLTLGENTADNGGIRLAFMAFLADAKRKNLDLTAKENGFTPAQQFFLAYGQNWCGTMRPEMIRLQVQSDPHSPDQIRVNGVVQNMTEFGQAFGCKAGQPMMPVKACHVW